MSANLNEKQERFCREYLVDLNGAQAAIRAGYSKKTARAIAYELLTKPHVQSYLLELRGKVAQKLEITQERVAQEYARLGFFDVRNLYNDDGTPKAISDLDDDTAAAVVGVDTATIGNQDVGIGQVLKIRLADKKAALDSICKMFGFNAPEKQEHSGVVQIEDTPAGRLELARQLAFLLRRGKD